MVDWAQSLKYVAPYETADRVKTKININLVRSLMEKQAVIKAKITDILNITSKEVKKIKSSHRAVEHFTNRDITDITG